MAEERHREQSAAAGKGLVHTARPCRAGKKGGSAAQEGFGASGPRAYPHCAISRQLGPAAKLVRDPA